MNASQVRSRDSQGDIRLGMGQSTLGAVLVAMRGDRIAAVMLDDDADSLRRAAHERFPAAPIVEGDSTMDGAIATVTACIDAPGTQPDLPLELNGTAFQQQVWQALRAIPCGTTLTYAELAARIGRPGAVRAVAGACAANEMAIIIPCHRVIRSDGSLSGYRWGPARKAQLLARERAWVAHGGTPV